MAKYGSKSKKEIALAYNIDSRTLLNWLSNPVHRKALGDMGVAITAHILPPKAVQYIYETFGEP